MLYVYCRSAWSRSCSTICMPPPSVNRRLLPPSIRSSDSIPGSHVCRRWKSPTRCHISSADTSNAFDFCTLAIVLPRLETRRAYRFPADAVRLVGERPQVDLVAGLLVVARFEHELERALRKVERVVGCGD